MKQYSIRPDSLADKTLRGIKIVGFVLVLICMGVEL